MEKHHNQKLEEIKNILFGEEGNGSILCHPLWLVCQETLGNKAGDGYWG